MKISDFNIGFDTDIIITIKVPLTERESLTDLFEEASNIDKYADYTLSLEKVKGKRSQNANSYMWVLCDKIARVIRTTKEEVYRRAVREVGVFNDVAVQDGEPCETLLRTWSKNGIGWFGEAFSSTLTDKDGNPMKRVRLYMGSHEYKPKDMSRLIDWVVDEARRLDLSTLTPRQIEELKAQWKG